MDVQEMLDIAIRYATVMSDAMILACYAKAHELGVMLSLVRRDTVATRGKRPTEDVDWDRMVRANADTRAMHC